MTEKFTYYWYIDSVWVQIYPMNNGMKLSKRIHEDWEGIYTNDLEGSFNLIDADFDIIVDLIPTNILFQVYENGTNITGTLIWSGSITQFNDFDYATKTVVCKSFFPLDDYASILSVIDSELETIINLDTEYDINYEFDGTITTKAQKIENIITPLLGLTFDFDVSDCWYDSEPIDLGKIRIADMKDITWLDAPSPNTAERKKITLKRILEWVQIMFRGYWYLDGTDLKFKTPADFVTNILNYEAKLIHKKNRKYDLNKEFKTETIKWNANNQPYVIGSNDAWDESIALISYTNGTKKLTYSLEDLCTRFTPSVGEYNFNGWFMAYVDNATDDVEKQIVTNTLINLENGHLCSQNIIYYFYRDYIHTNQINYTYDRITETVKPTHFKPFIELDEFQTILPSIASVYDGIRFELDGTDEIIGRTIEQSTDLNTNITTFKCFEFMNSIN